MRNLSGLNCSRFDRWKMEQLSLQRLTEKRFELRTVRIVTVMKNSYVLLSEDHHYYSVPYAYIGKKVKLIYSRSSVEIFYRYDLLTSHKRIKSPGNYSTIPEHLPSHHQRVTTWNPEYFIDRGAQISPEVEHYLRLVLQKKVHPEQAYKSCQGILALERKYGRERLISACSRALDIGYYNYKTVEGILQRGVDQFEIEKESISMPSHSNIRGREYYQ